MTKPQPKLSIIVIGYDMPRQLLNTIYSLSPQHQKNVSSDDYEIIVVENKSSHCADENKIKALGSNIKYYLRDEKGVSPAPAINFALSKTQGDFIGLLIDGARMVTPRVIEYALAVQRLSPHAIYAVPGFFIGPHEHQNAEAEGYNEEKEKALLAQIKWQENGYRLFDVASMSAANPKGVFQPFLECNCFFTSRDNFNAIGGADERFNLKGGGSLNFYLFKSIGMLATCAHYFLAPGEGSFHQLHGGVTTSLQSTREQDVLDFSLQLELISGESPFRSFNREPMLIGAVTSHSQRFLKYASNRATKRFTRMTKKQECFWQDDLNFSRWTSVKQ